MAQYFKPVNLDKQEFLHLQNYANGLMLMDHAWLSNDIVGCVVDLLRPGGRWQGDRLVWAGSYMDEGLFLHGINGKTSREKNLYDCCIEGDDGRQPYLKMISPFLHEGSEPTFLVNHTKLQFVRLDGLPEELIHESGWQIHPLPLLTCCGNGRGRGGGDFRGDNPYTGAWAGDCISSAYLPPQDCEEIRPDFTERK